MNTNSQSKPLINIQSPVSKLFDQWASTDRAKNMAEGHQPLIDALLEELTSESDNLGSIFRSWLRYRSFSCPSCCIGIFSDLWH